MRARDLLLFFLVAALATPQSASAYLDPASGSIIIQVVLGAIAGLALFIKLYWHKLKKLLGRSKEQSNESETGS